jgi:hypothetical protein
VTVAEPDFAPETAVTRIVAGTGGTAGAVKSPVLVMTPHWLPTQPVPESFQVTANAEEPDAAKAPPSCALNCSCPPAVTSALLGSTSMRPRASTVTIAVADLEGLASEVAVTMTVGGFGIVAGAV